MCDGCTGSDVRSKYRNPSQRRQRQHAQHPLARWTTAAWRCCGREPRHIAARRLRLDAKADAVLAARAAGVSQWAELLPQFLQQVLEYLEWDPVACAAIRATCSTWCGIHDSLYPGRLQPRGSLAVMVGKLGWFQSVTEVDLTRCEGGVPGTLAELESMLSLRSLTLPSSCAARAVDAEALYGLTTLTTLRFCPEDYEYDEHVEVVEWPLDLSRLTTLNSLDLYGCAAVADKEVLALSNLTGLADLNLGYCNNVTSEVLRAVIK